MTRDTERRLALTAAMQLPDASDLPKRAKRFTYAGDAAKRDDIKRELERAYLRWRMQESGIVEDSIGAVRRYSLRLVRRKSA